MLIHGSEADNILDMYGLGSGEANHPEDSQDTAGRPWDEQLQDAYTALANQRGIPVESSDDLYKDEDTARDARNAVEQVISYFHPDTPDLAAQNSPEASLTRPTSGDDTSVPSQPISALQEPTKAPIVTPADRSGMILRPAQAERGGPAGLLPLLDRVRRRFYLQTRATEIVSRSVLRPSLRPHKEARTR